MHYLPSNFSIRNIAQHISASVLPVSCSAFTIPISIPAPLSKPEHAPLSVSPTHDSIPIITVPLLKPSRKGKEKLSISGTAEKRKLSNLDDVEIVSESKQQMRVSTLPHRMTRSRSVAETPDVSIPSGSKSKGTKKSYRPIFLSCALSSEWHVHSNRDFILEKSINVEELTEKCNIIPILRYQHLFTSLQHVGTYSAWLTTEFYTNLTMDTFIEGSTHFQQVFIRDKWYPFGPTEINAYLGTPNHQVVPDPSPHILAAALTHNKEVSWPSTGLKSLKLTTVYSVLLCLASANYIPAVRHHLVSDQLATLLYKIINRLPFNLGVIIFSHLMSFLKKRETKVHLPYPSLIFGILQDHGFMPYKDEVKYHYDDRASLTVLPVVATATPPVSAPASSADTVLAFILDSQAVPKEPQTLVDHRQIVVTLEASIVQIQHSVAFQQVTISGLEKLRDAQLQEITRMEEIHAQILADTGAGSSSSETEDDDEDSVSGTPFAR
ncbi:PREDICTED: uncharacterized protein LOC109159963 [Ipomoea nil]|uniref:uncharacterized protein LOC109159963 n=1 Tax=Ipomoea nil TaxID=35883 RepID=UPI000900FDFC|nr:PREDICTED: uncharacterized protein LOC109159963 [Ipomoea nil]